VRWMVVGQKKNHVVFPFHTSRTVTVALTVLVPATFMVKQSASVSQDGVVHHVIHVSFVCRL